MEKTTINLKILLPEIINEKDECIQRIIELMQDKRGIEKVHVISENFDSNAKFCIHYDTENISITEVQQLAKVAGNEITEKFGHLLIEVKGIKQPGQAETLASAISNLEGIISVSTPGTGFLLLEYDREKIKQSAIKNKISELGLLPANKDVFKENKTLNTHSENPSKLFPNYLNILKENTELLFVVICGIMLAIGFGLSLIPDIHHFIPVIFYLLAYFAGGFFISKEAASSVLRGRFEIDFLMVVAAIGAAVLGKWAEGSLLLFLFNLGHSLEHYALDKAKRSIEGLSQLIPKTALLKTETGLKEVGVEELSIGQIIVVKPNSIISADGIVVKGSSSVNQTAITGESIPVEKSAYSYPFKEIKDLEKVEEVNKVFAGTINGTHSLEIAISKITADSTISRLIKMVKEAQKQKSSKQNFVERIEKYYVPAVLILVCLLLFVFLFREETFSESFYRAMAVLVASSPCALAISTPSTVLSGVARAAKGGVLIKGGKPLEALGETEAIAFDKTGTLTIGNPKLTGVYPLNEFSEEELLKIIVSVEKLSDHPIATAIVKGGEERLKQTVYPAGNLESITAKGLKANWNGFEIYIGNLSLFTGKNKVVDESVRSRITSLEADGNTTMLVEKDNQFIGIITLMDRPREEAKETIDQLKEIGIRKIVMLSGDNQRVAEAIAEEVGITDFVGSLIPEQKVKAVEDLMRTNKNVAMVGDGVNDAPAMAKSTVGIAMGAAGSPIALETADIALLGDNLKNLPFAIALSRKAKQITTQNLFISIGMVVILLPATIFGLSMVPAIIGHEGSTLLVVFNALRLLRFRYKT